MNLKDIEGAVEDMLEHHGAHFDDTVYILQSDGSYKPVIGFYIGEDGKVYIE